ncbi:MAG: hypothetical protein FPO08_08095 [Geobacter sp.]|nr:MAG: hypothetical protein FPO08_08095 [Geobacter sp.]
MKNKFGQVPKALRRHLQFVCWKYHPDPNNPSKDKKVPFDPKTGRKASVTAHATWGTYDQAISCCKEGGYDGIGFVFSSKDPFIGIDLDSCRNKKTGEIALWAQDIINEFDSYNSWANHRRGAPYQNAYFTP